MPEMRDLERALYGAPVDEMRRVEKRAAAIAQDGSVRHTPLQLEEIELLLNRRYQGGYGEGHCEGFVAAEETFRAEAARDMSRTALAVLDVVLETLDPVTAEVLAAGAAVAKHPRSTSSHHRVAKAAAVVDEARESLRLLRSAVAEHGVPRP